MKKYKCCDCGKFDDKGEKCLNCESLCFTVEKDTTNILGTEYHNKDLRFVLSRCHEEHWELVYIKPKNKWELVCPICQSGSGIEVKGPDLTETTCDYCKYCGDKCDC